MNLDFSVCFGFFCHLSDGGKDFAECWLNRFKGKYLMVEELQWKISPNLIVVFFFLNKDYKGFVMHSVLFFCFFYVGGILRFNWK